MDIIVSANSKYARYLYVMLVSLYENNAEENIRLFVMQRDFTTADKESIRNLTNEYGNIVEFLFVDETRFKNLPTTSKFSLETYFRLIMSELLPKTVDKILYLDVDVIIRGRLKEFYQTDISNYIAAVCQDTDYPVLEKKKRELFHRIGDMRYFNAGVMLWNIEKLRKKYIFDDFLQAAMDLGYNLQYADQEILNYLLYDRVLYCDSKKYNYVARGLVQESDLSNEDAIILHYAGCNPWQNGLKNDLYKIWWRYAKQTPFYVELLEENLWREMGFGSEKEANNLRDMESLEIYKYAFQLKSTGRIRKSIKSRTQHIAIYGAGTMAEVLYELLADTESWDCVCSVVDRNRKGDFHGVEISSDIVEKEDMLWIVTPVYRSKEVLNQVQKTVGSKCTVITLLEWLKKIP